MFLDSYLRKHLLPRTWETRKTEGSYSCHAKLIPIHTNFYIYIYTYIQWGQNHFRMNSPSLNKKLGFKPRKKSKKMQSQKNSIIFKFRRLIFNVVLIFQKRFSVYIYSLVYKCKLLKQVSHKASNFPNPSQLLKEV